MDILNAILAFSVSMLVFSTMALVVVEVFYRFNKTREKYFSEMINAFFSDLIWKKLHGVDLGNESRQSLRQDFLNIMTSVSGLVNLDLQLEEGVDNFLEDSEQKPKVKAKSAYGIHVSKTTERLTAVEFAQRLARTKVGKLLLERGEDKVKAIVMDLASQLNAISSGASSDFRQRSRKASLWASAVIAIGLNIDAVYLFQSYTTDQSLSERVISSAPAVIDAYEQQQEKMEALEKELAEIENKGAETALKELQSSIKENKDTIQQSASSLIDLGVPIGFNYFPFCSPVATIGEKPSERDSAEPADNEDQSNEPLDPPLSVSEEQGPEELPQANLKKNEETNDKRIEEENTKYQEVFADSRCEYLFAAKELTELEKLKNAGRIVGWIAGLLLAIVLIGQGSPFWFQMFQRLSAAMQVIKGVSLLKSKADSSIEQAKADEQYSPAKAVEIYVQTILSESEELDHLLTVAREINPKQSRAKDKFDVQARAIKAKASQNG